jgi:hypothetical protein
MRYEQPDSFVFVPQLFFCSHETNVTGVAQLREITALEFHQQLMLKSYIHDKQKFCLL